MARGVRRLNQIDVEIGQRIRAQRKIKRLSQTELANKLGVTFQQVQKYENGTNRVAGGRLQLIAQALGVSIGFLFGDNGNGRVDKETDANLRMIKRSDTVRLINAFDKLTGKVRASIVDMVENLAGGRG